MKRLRPAAALLSGLLLPLALPTLSAAAPALDAAPSTALAKVTAGPGAEGPDLSYANRTSPPAGMPDWSRVGFRGGRQLPGDGDLTDDAGCRINPDQLAAKYGVRADDGADDTTGLQKAVDDIKAACSPNANFNRLSLISLPAGRIDVSRQIYVDADYLVLRGQGSGDGGTRLVFRPDVDTRYDTVVNGRWDQDGMKAGSGSDVGTGGWIWPGRGMFRVQTRDVATRYQDDWAAAPANRKDIFEGSVNQHWASGIKVAASPADPGYAARQGQSTVQLDAKADMKKFSPGGYVWVGAANSVKFYEQQGVTDRSQMDNLHMRQQMFRVNALDAAAKTVTLDRPLEWDLPVDSASDGSPALGDKPYPSKVTPLKVVQGVGFEDFAFTQDMNGLPKLGGGTYQLTPDEAVHNYGNIAPEYAMHGIVFKWAANDWVRGLKAEMTGSHPIVTEDARNLQIERNSFDGAWNKGKGGNGYLRGSRVWDSLYAYNLSRNLRHFTFQWSASGNVAFRNDLDSDLNLHGGWEHNNLFEQNTLRVPYEHRSGNCRTNCGGEGGEVDEGTWYPIWWAAGPKAVKWSGSSGPQNVFYDNTMIKQATPGGPFEPYAPYGTRSGTAFQFGSANGAPDSFQPLSQDGQAIPDWGGRETLDYTGKGVVPLDAGKRPSLFLADTGGLDPRDDNSRTVATWNMQGSDTVGANSNKYSNDLPRLYGNGFGQAGADIVALQEAGAPPGGATFLGDISTANIHYWDNTGRVRPVQEYRIGTAARPAGFLYWLRTDFSGTAFGRVNMAIYSRTRVAAQDVYVTNEAVVTDNWDSRPALGINVGGVVYFSVHGSSRSRGGDVPQHLGFIRDQMAQAGDLPWIALGDYNRTPDNLRNAVGAHFTVHAQTLITHPTPLVTTTSPGSVIDYAVVPTAQAQPAFTGAARVNLTTSDHYPVVFTLGDLPTQQPPAQQQTAQTVPTQAVLRSAATTNAAGPSGTSHVVADQSINQANLPSQVFSLTPDPEYPGYYRLFHANAPYSGRYLGQEGGARDARTVLWPSEAPDQLWAPADQIDGTWTLRNYVTGQFLTDLGGGQALAGRDYDGSAAQRWFLQDPHEAAGLNEIVSGDGSQPTTLTVDDLETAPEALLFSPNGHHDNQRFGAISAGRVGSDACFYLVNQGKYVNSTADHPGQPLDGNIVTMGAFRPNDDGYLWCATPDGSNGTLLTNHTTPVDQLNLTRSATSDLARLSSPTSTATKFHWSFVAVTQ
ncbi:ricin-type beta-trefoil lectin protein [Streptomyces sp. PanSC19]|uniref:RICIN domain-containing protein n=1 Tax=Streptomyces sp. PanSC19 TaxID=1520455 RepID=UPI000F48F4A3|nr:RICIN domain-containing protein [Streptomyces sp. PanSC19]ROQ26493.1 ricin-type beta-trefoil lectin protein [Streptomyces sp. PanSC19]